MRSNKLSYTFCTDRKKSSNTYSIICDVFTLHKKVIHDIDSRVSFLFLDINEREAEMIKETVRQRKVLGLKMLLINLVFSSTCTHSKTLKMT